MAYFDVFIIIIIVDHDLAFIHCATVPHFFGMHREMHSAVVAVVVVTVLCCVTTTMAGVDGEWPPFSCLSGSLLQLPSQIESRGGLVGAREAARPGTVLCCSLYTLNVREM